MRGEFDAIREQVPNHLLQSRRVAGNHSRRRIVLHPQSNSFGFGCRPHDLNGRLNHRQEIDRLHVQIEFAADDARHVHQIFNQLCLNPGVAFDGLNRVLRGFRIERLTSHYRKPAQDRGQRCPQLVRQRGQKFVFDAIGNFGLSSCFMLSGQKLFAFFLSAFTPSDVAQD